MTNNRFLFQENCTMHIMNEVHDTLHAEYVSCSHFEILVLTSMMHRLTEGQLASTH